MRKKKKRKKSLLHEEILGKAPDLMMRCTSMCSSVLFLYIIILLVTVYELSFTSLTTTALLYNRKCLKPTHSRTFSLSLTLPFSHLSGRQEKSKPNALQRCTLKTSSMFKSYSPRNLAWCLYQMQTNRLVSWFSEGT